MKRTSRALPKCVLIAQIAQLVEFGRQQKVGMGEEITFQERAHLIADEVAFKSEPVRDIAKANGQLCRCLNPRRAEELFGFEATWRMCKGSQKTMAWFRLYHKFMGKTPPRYCS